MPLFQGHLDYKLVSDMITYYGKFLQNEENLEVEINKWKLLNNNAPDDNCPKDAFAALTACDHEYFQE